MRLFWPALDNLDNHPHALNDIKWYHMILHILYDTIIYYLILNGIKWMRLNDIEWYYHMILNAWNAKSLTWYDNGHILNGIQLKSFWGHCWWLWPRCLGRIQAPTHCLRCPSSVFYDILWISTWCSAVKHHSSFIIKQHTAFLWQYFIWNFQLECLVLSLSTGRTGYSMIWYLSLCFKVEDQLRIRFSQTYACGKSDKDKQKVWMIAWYRLERAWDHQCKDFAWLARFYWASLLWSTC